MRVNMLLLKHINEHDRTHSHYFAHTLIERKHYEGAYERNI